MRRSCSLWTSTEGSSNEASPGDHGPIAMVILERFTWRDSSCHLARVNDEPAGCPVDPKMKNSQERVRLSDGVRKRDTQRPLCQLAVDVLPPGCVEFAFASAGLSPQ